MQISPIKITNYNQKINTKNAQPSFCKFIKLQMTIGMDMTKGLWLLEGIKQAAGGEIGIYRRSLDDLAGYNAQNMSKLLFIDDNHGKFQSGLKKVMNYLFDNGVDFRVVQEDLFPTRKPSLLENIFGESALQKYAWCADPKKMIKL